MALITSDCYVMRFPERPKWPESPRAARSQVQAANGTLLLEEDFDCATGADLQVVCSGENTPAAVGQTAILLTSPLPSVGVSIWTFR